MLRNKNMIVGIYMEINKVDIKENAMGRTEKPSYLDTVSLHSELSDAELDKLIEIENEKSKSLTEWPKM